MAGLGSGLVAFGVLLMFGAGLYQLIAATGFFNEYWGIPGVLALWVFPPSWFLAPFVMWVASGTFPVAFFIAWVVGWPVAGAVVAAGNALGSTQKDLSVQ